MCGWIVVRDHLENQDVEVMGPSDISEENKKELKSGKGKKFQMFDDDGELYYSGRIVGDYDGFEPLDDYGTPNAGCTDIKYFENGKWESL